MRVGTHCAFFSLIACAPVLAQQAAPLAEVRKPDVTKQEPPKEEARKVDALAGLSESLEVLARRVNRSVVKIVTTGFGFTEDSDSRNTSLLTRQRSTGSGVILSADGYIATNAHVVQGARLIRVQLPVSERAARVGLAGKRHGGSVLVARIVGVDHETDIAVLKVDANGLPFLTLGESRSLRQGQIVLAFGSPLGLPNSVSMGVVSAVTRQLKEDSPMVYIQTDASINPGNSGGPLVDVNGRVMGLNTMILSQSGGSEGIGFAIPSDTLRNVFDQIRKEGHVHRGQVGLKVQTITPLLASGLGLSRDWGVLVADAIPDGPAEKAGLKSGDILLSVNGRPLENARQLEVDVDRSRVGSYIKLEVLRGDDQLTVDVPVGAQDADPQRFADLVDPTKNLIPKLGILGVGIDKRLAAMLPDMRRPYGVVVAAKTPGADGFDLDLRPGDVIHALNGEPTATVEALQTALAQLKPGDAVVLQIERDSELMYVPFELE